MACWSDGILVRLVEKDPARVDPYHFQIGGYIDPYPFWIDPYPDRPLSDFDSPLSQSPDRPLSILDSPLSGWPLLRGEQIDTPHRVSAYPASIMRACCSFMEFKG